MKHIVPTFLFAPMALAGLVKRLDAKEQPGWTYLGCFSDSQSARVLPVTARRGSDVTATYCQSKCQDMGYLYAGAEHGGECYCGNNPPSDSTRQDESGCQTPCSGDNTQACGGNDRISIYWNGNSGPIYDDKPLPYGWEQDYCYVDNVNARVLPKSIAAPAGGMYPGYCTEACGDLNYQYAGTENGNQCFCGNNTANAAVAYQGQCNIRCKGDNGTVCGGASRISGYHYYLNYQLPIHQKTGFPRKGWSWKACSSTFSHQNWQYLQLGTTATPNRCIEACDNYGLTVAALQGQNCACSNPSTAEPITPQSKEQCDERCAGNSSLACGSTQNNRFETFVKA